MESFKIESMGITGARKITPPTIFRDFRGSYVETYNAQLYRESGIAADFVQDDISVSKRGVLRGIHGDRKTWKLISCLWGKFQFVVVDWRPDSPTYGRWELIELSDENRLQVLVPPGCGNGHLVLSEQAIFHYKQTTYYERESQFTIPWNDPALAIPWAVRDPILSARDGGPGLSGRS